MFLLFQGDIFWFHVSFRGSTSLFKTSVFFAFFLFPEQKLELILPMPMAHDASISCLQKFEFFFYVFWHQKKSPKKKTASDCHFAPLNTTKIFHAFNWKFADVQRKARKKKRLMTSTGWLKYGISFSSLENSKGKVEQVYIYICT